MILDFDNKWNTGQTITVGFINGSAALHEKVEQAAKVWEEFANLKFDFDSGLSHHDIRIKFAAGMNDSKIGSDNLSFDNDDEETMKYLSLNASSSEEDFGRYAIHEFGHAIGLIHEHLHPDFNFKLDEAKLTKYYTIDSGFNYSIEDCENNLFRDYARNVLRYSEFDPDSLMMYPIPANANSNGEEYVQNSKLSDIDKKFIAAMYPQSEAEIIKLPDDTFANAEIKDDYEENNFKFSNSNPDSTFCQIKVESDSNVVLCLYNINGEDSKKNGTRHYIAPFSLNEGIGSQFTYSPDLSSPGEYFLCVRHFEPKGRAKYTIKVKVF